MTEILLNDVDAFELNQKDQIDYTFPPEVSIYDVVSLKSVLLAHLANTSVLNLNAGGVNYLDLAGVQMLLYVRREAQSQGKSMQINDMSAACESVIQVLGLAGVFHG